MGLTTLGHETVIADDTIQEAAVSVMEDLRDDEPDAITITAAGSSRAVPPQLAAFILHVIERAACGATTIVRSFPDELTTTAAAELIGLSRPTIMKMVQEGRLPARKVGTHTRIPTVSVLEFAEARRHEKRAAFNALRDASDNLGGI